MSAENEKRTVEVRGVPEGVDEELLQLYFANKRRSGGGPLVSVEKNGDHAFLVFEEAEVAARVLSKEQHVVYNAEITVRRPVLKDQRRLLLCGLQPNTCMELVELYVENVMEVDVDEYTLTPLLGRDALLVYLHQPLATDFFSLSSKISKKPLEGSRLTLEQIEQTDSVLVENLHPGLSVRLLTLHFEGSQPVDLKVKEVVMLSESTARVTFVHPEAVEHVLKHPHILNDATLTVSPYHVFNQPSACQAQSDPSLSCVSVSSDDGPESEVDILDSVQKQASPLTVDSIEIRSSQQTALATVNSNMRSIDIVGRAMADVTEVMPDTHSVDITIQDSVKLQLFQLSTLPQDIHQTHRNVNTQVVDDTVHLTGPDKQELQRLKTTIVDLLAGMAQSTSTLDVEMAKFLENDDVREKLLQTFSQLGITAIYTVLDKVIVVTALSQEMATQGCVSLTSQLCTICIPVQKEYECMLYSEEWAAFLRTLGLCSARVSEDGASVDLWTLKGLEDEKRSKVTEFLLTPIEQEKFIGMEPGMLKYVQMYFHQLMAEMNQVVILPIDGKELCGLRIQGLAGHCQNAQELLQSMVSSVCTKTLTINQSGVARFLVESEGTGILNEMRAKFQICISLDKIHWAPLQSQDIFEAAWKLLSHINFQKAASARTAASLSSALTDNGDLDKGSQEEDDEDLYTAGDTGDPEEGMMLDEASAGPSSLKVSPGATGLQEQEQMSLAIQNSLFSTAEDEELQMVLELSRQEGSYISYAMSTQHSMPRCLSTLLEDMRAADVALVKVYAGFSSDLIRADIALKKKVSLRQVEETMEQKGLTDMSDFHRQAVQVIKRKHAVEIRVQGNMLTVSGFKDFVTEALPDVRLLLQRVSSRRHEDELLSNIQWARQDPATAAMTPYEPDTIVFLENTWRMKEKEVAILLNGQPHIVDLVKMEDYNVASKKSLTVARTAISDLDVDVEACLRMTPERSLLANLPEVSRIDENSEEFQEVVKNFYGSIKGYHSKIRIVKVEKLGNRLLCSQYKLKKASLYKSGVHNEVERTLYHGTSESSVKDIYLHGFNRSFCGKNATVYGQGVYFALNSALSVADQYSPPNADGHKFVFVAKVLTGDFTLGCSSMKAAPLKESADIPLRYDSVTDNLSKPTMFVIFNDTQAYPEYLITCQNIPR
ncbi:uncharacterized protein parp10 [Gadus morhua]|uniref:uncharacterized protein parp10 n=1 Tax=Gadus morhua TaxID=8049 RepID=UPI0011B74CBC|nr:protein mono-ADP-ribosyltransferase PARP10 [Gadus morhua]XP_030203509.1 protein mono-ADP-ribosyltransferase PARP10 [Gadus morhua]